LRGAVISAGEKRLFLVYSYQCVSGPDLMPVSVEDGVALIARSALWKWMVIRNLVYFQSFQDTKTPQRGSRKFAAAARLDGWRR